MAESGGVVGGGVVGGGVVGGGVVGGGGCVVEDEDKDLVEVGEWWCCMFKRCYLMGGSMSGWVSQRKWGFLWWDDGETSFWLHGWFGESAID